MNKSELIEALEDSHERISEAIEGLGFEAMSEPGVAGDWSIKDILAHLARWEAEVVKLLWQAHQGIQPTTLLNEQVADDEVNARWHDEDKTRPMERILGDFHGVRDQTIRRLEYFTDKDLIDPQRFPWLGGQPLWEWVAGDSFEHDNEHLKQMLAWLAKREER